MALKTRALSVRTSYPMGRTWIVLAGAAVLLSACASARQQLPFFHHQDPALPSASSYQRDPHRQYFDKLRKRFYYYDPDAKAYFWEDGQPKR